MSKRTAWILAAVAALALVAWFLWQRRRAPAVALPPPAPSQPATAVNNSTTIAGAFMNLVGAASNWGAQWFVNQAANVLPTKGATANKPPPLTSAAVTDSKPGPVTNPITTPTYLA